MEIPIPTEWSDITIEKYIALRPVLAVESNEVTKIINVLCLLSGKKRQEIEQLSIPQYSDLIKKMEFLHKPIPEELNKDVFKINGEYYKFCLDPSNILFGEYISVMEILEKAKNNPEIIYDNIHNLLTVICKPLTKKWWGFKNKQITNNLVKETSSNFYKNMPITIAYPITVFFYQNLTTLTQTIKTFMELEYKRLMKEANKEVVTRTVGGGLD